VAPRGLRALAETTTFAQACEKLSDGTSPVAHLIKAAANEIRLSANLRADGLKELIVRHSERIEMAAGSKISRGTGILATLEPLRRRATFSGRNFLPHQEPTMMSGA
jgi:biopolymer transport protein ExbB